MVKHVTTAPEMLEVLELSDSLRAMFVGFAGRMSACGTMRDDAPKLESDLKALAEETAEVWALCRADSWHRSAVDAIGRAADAIVAGGAKFVHTGGDCEAELIARVEGKE